MQTVVWKAGDCTTIVVEISTSLSLSMEIERGSLGVESLSENKGGNVLETLWSSNE